MGQTSPVIPTAELRLIFVHSVGYPFVPEESWNVLISINLSGAIC